MFVLPALAEINASDIGLLLIVTCLFELTIQALNFRIGRKSDEEKELLKSLLTLKFQCAESKRLGPAAFVETSKLERSILAREKEISELNSSKETQLAKMKMVTTRLNYVFYVTVTALYWGIPMLLLNDVEKQGDASSYLKTYFFPMLFGISGRVANFGQPVGSIAPLFVVWAGQVTISEISGCVISIMNS